MSETFDLVVVGGGAAGFFGALTAAEMNPDMRIIILERGTRPLAKVLISGGGRCNVTHACFDPAELTRYYPRGARELRGPFTRFQPADTMDWFEQRGVPLKTEQDGRVFPVSDRSESIANCLLDEAARLRIHVRSRSTVRRVKKISEGFLVSGIGFEDIPTRKILLAPGGNAQSIYDSAANMGHTILPPVPSLFTFNIKDQRIGGLQGIAVDPCLVSLHCGGEEFSAEGPILITHWGLSGPAVLKLSAWGARELSGSGYQAGLSINWLPGENSHSVYEKLLSLKERQPRSKLTRQLLFTKLPARLWERITMYATGGENRLLAETPNRVLHSLAEELTGGSFQVQGKGVFKEEFVTCGGIALDEVNFKTMESRLQPGLFLAGELLDIDGLTGGFNFQSAWTTGYLAGKGLSAVLN